MVVPRKILNIEISYCLECFKLIGLIFIRYLEKNFFRAKDII